MADDEGQRRPGRAACRRAAGRGRSPPRTSSPWPRTPYAHDRSRRRRRSPSSRRPPTRTREPEPDGQRRWTSRAPLRPPIAMPVRDRGGRPGQHLGADASGRGALQVALRHEAPAWLDRRDRVHRRQEVLRPQHDPERLEHGRPGRADLDDPRPVGHRQVRVHQAHGRPALPGRGRRPGPRRVGAEHAGRRAVRDAQEVRRPVPGRRAVRLDEPVRQRGLPAAPAHGQGRGGDHGDLRPPPA